MTMPETPLYLAYTTAGVAIATIVVSFIKDRVPDDLQNKLGQLFRRLCLGTAFLGLMTAAAVANEIYWQLYK